MSSFGDRIMRVMQLFGAVVIFLASLALSGLLCFREREKLRCSEAYFDLMRYIGRQIVCFNRPFGEIIHSLDPALRAACRLPMAGENFADMFDAASPPLAQNVARIVREFAQELGKSYRDEQLAACDAVISALDDEITIERKRLVERVRLIRCICLCGGLAVIILLI